MHTQASTPITKTAAATLRKAPVQQRIYLTGHRGTGFTVLVKDNAAHTTIWTMEAPSYAAGNAMVRALRALDAERGTIF